ncbi:MAG: dipicolinate synthase subunit B [Oscillospiraceae bacterium]|nr:dipicolinate synthase subunit B [Oscillospiraceae bacterium]
MPDSTTPKSLAGVKIGVAVTGSFCTFKRVFAQISRLVESGADVTPIMSFNACSLDTRFGSADEQVTTLEEICGKGIINTIPLAEPIGPKKMFDLIVVAPCTGNTLAKLAMGITDTPVTMAVKSHLRNRRPVLIRISTNDALSASAKNIGMLMNTKNIYFIPFSQDDPEKKSTSLIADFTKMPEAICAALEKKQLQPVLIG